MYQLAYIYKVLLLHLSTCLLMTEVTSTEEGSSYLFYQQPDYPRDCKEASDQCSSHNESGVYSIRPDGYLKPFEVYCDNDISSGGWTVIQRRTDATLTFQRVWEDYRSGFGFLASEFWIGHDRLSYVTNQAVYELRADLMLSKRSSFYITYKSFRISDEWGGYAIVSAEEFRSNWSCIVLLCPQNTTRDGCTCHNLCTDPIRQTDCYTSCAETCVPEGCLVHETNSFITNGESVIKADCTQNCTCVDNQLLCNTDYECSADASCKVKNEIRKCYCNDGFEGDGETCNGIFRDCYENLTASASFLCQQYHDYWLKYINGAQFSTRDQDNDGCSYHDCAEAHKGAWWYKPLSGWCTACYYSYSYCYHFETRSSCYNICTVSNLNGRSNGGNGENLIYWTSNYNDCNHKFAEMKIRPIS